MSAPDISGLAALHQKDEQAAFELADQSARYAQHVASKRKAEMVFEEFDQSIERIFKTAERNIIVLFCLAAFAFGFLGMLAWAALPMGL